MRVLEEERKRGTFTERSAIFFRFDQNMCIVQDFESHDPSGLFREQKMDSKRDVCGDVGIWSAHGATLHSCVSGELARLWNYLKSKFCMARLVPNFADASMYTLLERRIWNVTSFSFSVAKSPRGITVSTSLSDGSRTLSTEEGGLLSFHAVGDLA